MSERKFTLTGMSDYQIHTDNEMSVWAENVSDGYHTMHELYQHRMALNIALFHRLKKDYVVCKSKLHNDGTMFQGYFVVWANTEVGQISYHYSLKHWDKFDLTELEKIPIPFDGHGSKEVLERLAQL